MRKAKRLGRAVVALGVVSAAMLLAWRPGVLALDPALDISQYAHTSWKVRDGFFKDSIGSIAQTTDGYLWLGTQFGLVRFDGVRAVPWQPPAGQQLPSSHIRSLLAARDGRLWIGTWLGLASWKDGKLTLHPELAGQSVGRILEDREGTVWAGTRYPPPGKLCAFRSGSVQCYGEDGEFGDRASSLYEDRAGNLWVGAESGLWRWKPGSPKLYPLGDFESSQGVVESDNGALLIAERGGIKHLVDEKVVEYRLPVEGLRFQPSRLLRDRDGGLWIGTFDRGLVHVHQGRMDLFSQSDGLSSNYIRDLFEDREGNIWVATDNGLDRFRNLAVVTVSVHQGLSQANPWSVLAARDGSVWVGTLDGLNRLRDGQITVYRKRDRSARRGSAGMTGKEPGALGSVREITDRGLPDDLIHSLFEDDRQRIWVSTRGGVAYFENDRFIPVSSIPGGVHAISGDAGGNIWLSEDQSLIQVRDGRVVKQFPWAILGRKVAAIPMLANPSRGGLWLGFNDGTGLAYFQDGQIRASYGTAEELGKGIVGGLRLDADGTIWAATEGGLSRLKDGRIATLTAKNGLPCDTVHWVIEDDDHAFWLYTACGLARVARSEVEAWAAAVEKDKDTRQKVQATVFDNSDGVRVHAAPGGFTPRVSKSPDGRIWFLPWDGVGVIDPRRLPFNPLPPPVQIEQITADGQPYDASQGLRLPPLVRDLAIDFTALSLVAPEKIRFRYKLEGQDPDWKEVAGGRRAQYSNLAPGYYHFRVSACNNSGVWNEAGALLDFSIAPAYYETNWFRALCVAAFLALLGGLYQLRIHQVQRQEKRLRAVIERMPTMAFAVHPDGSPEFVNRRWLDYAGLSADATADGRWWEATIHSDDAEVHLKKWRAALASGEPFENEARHRSASGKYRWFLVRAVPFRDRQGKIVKWYGTLTDIEDRKHTEQALQRSEAYQAEAQRLTHTGSWAYSPATGKINYWSEEIFRIHGLGPHRDSAPDPEEFYRRILHPEDRDRVHEILQEAFGEKTDFEEEYRIVRPDGAVRHLHVIGHPVLDESGALVEYVGTTVDVTERKRAEERHRAYLRFLESLDRVNRTMQGTNDLEKIMSDVLDAVLEIFACDRAWLVYPCDPDAASWRAIMEHTRPEFPGAFALGTDLPMEPEFATVLRTARSSPGAVLFGPTYGHQLPQQAAERFSIRSMMLMTLYPKGDQPYLFGLHQCSHPRLWTPQEQRLFEEIGHRLADALTSLLMFRSLRESERRLAEAESMAHFGYWDRDSDAGRVTLSRESCRIFGFEPEERMFDLQQYDEQWYTLIHPEDAPRIDEAAAAAVSGGPRFDVEYRVIRPDGDVRIVHSRGEVTRDESGRPRRMFGTIQDITELRQAESELRTSEARFRTFVDFAADAFMLYRADGTVIDVNRQACEDLGYSRDELIGMTHNDFAVDLDEGTLQRLGEHLETGEVFTFEDRHRRKDGSVFPVEVRMRAFWQDGRRLSISLARDITERKRAEAALRKSELQAAGIIESAMDAIISVDSDQRITLFNESAEQMFCCSAAEAMGQPLDRFIPERFRAMHREHIRAFGETQVTQRRMGALGSIWGVSADGKEFPIEASISQLEVAGQKFFTVVLRDITDRKRAEAALRESEQRYRTLFEKANDAIFLENERDEIIEANERACALLGYSREELLTMKVSDLQAPEVRGHAGSVVRDEIEKHGSATFESVDLHRSGRRIVVEVTNTPISDQGQKLTLSIVRDITERKRAEEELRQAQAAQFEIRLESRVRERTRIARELHDTLLQSFQGLLLSFQSVLKILPERPLEARQRLKSALDQAAEAITDARDAIQGLRSLAAETGDLARAITAVGKELTAHRTDSNSPAIHVEVKGAPRNLNPAVRDEAYRIASEALRNAFRHAQAQRIAVEIRYDERQFCVLVRDDGKGLDEETVRRAAAAGHFGLPGMRERAESVGGRLEVWSRLDSGTEVELSIPGAIAYDGSARRSW